MFGLFGGSRRGSMREEGFNFFQDTMEIARAVAYTVMPEDFIEYCLRHPELLAEFGYDGGDPGPGGGADDEFVCEPAEPHFGPGDPSCFYELEGGVPFRGREAAKRLLDLKIQTLGTGGRLTCLLCGPRGAGKGALARIVAHRIRRRRASLGLPPGRFFEVSLAYIMRPEEWERFVAGLRDLDVVVLREIEELVSWIGSEPLRRVLDDPVPGGGPGGEDRPGVAPRVSWIATTRDPASLDEASGGSLRGWFDLEIHLGALEADVLVEILHDHDVPITEAAAREIASLTGGLPWDAIVLYATAAETVEALGRKRITREEVRHAHEMLKELGRF